ncbi:hypothetical protein FJZ39_03535 [Candidatus Saccharibacteria bacterium]|nr:hypothetical protein [Candidatus Saccharibacteria bacterium]
MDRDQEVTTTERNVEQVGDTTVQRESVQRASEDKVSAKITVARLVWFITGVIVSLLLLRFIFLLLGASEASAFVSFIYGLSAVFALPFEGMFGTPTYGQSTISISTLVGALIYTLIGWGIVKLLTLNSRHARSV